MQGRIRDVAARACYFAPNGFLSCHEIRGVRTSRSRPLTATTLYAPWEGTNNGHPTMILTGMTHGDYQPALHPPPSDLGKFSPLLANHHHQSTSMAFPAAPSMGHEEAQTLATTTTHSLL